jgi:hypothetical protein
VVRFRERDTLSPVPVNGPSTESDPACGLRSGGDCDDLSPRYPNCPWLDGLCVKVRARATMGSSPTCR